MSFRTVVVRNRAKLDFQLNYLVCRGEEEKRIHLSEITCLIVESTAVSLTAALLCEMSKKKIKVIFCDEKHNPHGELVGYYDNYRSAKRVAAQSEWKPETKTIVWTDIVRHKIDNQAAVLKLHQRNGAEELEALRDEVELGDVTNREGHAAKIYFNALFGCDRRTANFVNGALNYGYAILLSAFNREITAAGYITQLGVFHRNEFNYFNLSCDLMETFRPVVDDAVVRLQPDDSDFKDKLADLLNCRITINGNKLYLNDAVAAYVRSVADALNFDNAGLIKNFTAYELPLYENNSNV